MVFYYVSLWSVSALFLFFTGFRVCRGGSLLNVVFIFLLLFLQFSACTLPAILVGGSSSHHIIYLSAWFFHYLSFYLLAAVLLLLLFRYLYS